MTPRGIAAGVALIVTAACTPVVTGPSPADPHQLEPTVDPELAEHLALCGNRTPQDAFRDSALPWFAAHAEQATPALIARVQEGGGSTERAATALGHLRAEAGIPALEEALRDGIITHQAAAARALWAIGTPESDAALARVISAGGSPAKRALHALKPFENRSPCALIAEADAVPELADAAQTARERCGC